MFGEATRAKIDEIVTACRRYGSSSTVVLSGVPGTGKTFLALAAAQKCAGHPLFVRQIQFHQSYAYDDLVEGLKPTPSGGFEVRAGILTEWNDRALADPANRYVLLIEEFTRANVSAVLGEALTYVEYRDRFFDTPISRRRMRLAENLVILATMNPQDRSALELDDAMMRRMRIISCPPDVAQLREMLQSSLTDGGNTAAGQAVTNGLVRLFEEMRHRYPATFEQLMPFGHGMFARVATAEDLTSLWHTRIRHLLYRLGPEVPPHPFLKDIEELYPWKNPAEPAEQTDQVSA